MSKFSDFISSYDDFKTNNKINIDYINSRGYGWRLGVNAKSAFSKHLEEQDTDQFTDDMKSKFKNIFEKGHDMLGIEVLGTCSGDYANKVFLYKIAEHKKTCTLNNVEFKSYSKLLEPKRVQDPITSMMFYWNYCLKPENLSVKDTKGNVMTDSRAKENLGQFVLNNDSEMISGSVNYKTGEFYLSRTTNNNVITTDDTIAKYNKLIASGGSSGSSSSGSSSGNVPKPDPVALTTENYNLTYIAYESPVKVIWEYELPTE